LVSGKLNADNYIITNASNKNILKTITEKQQQLNYNGSVLVYEKVSPALKNKACLNENQLNKIAYVLESTSARH